MRVAVMGASGRMGQTLIRSVLEHDDMTLSGAIDRKGADVLGQDAGQMVGLEACGICVTDDPLKVFIDSEAVIDFTLPEASLFYAELAAQARIVHVMGTTGFSKEQEEKILAAASHARIIKAGNMSLGVNLLAKLVEKASMSLNEEFDIEIVEMHHKHKVDAPSGTALLLGEAAAAGREIDLASKSVMSREGHTGAREDGDIGFATLRGGSVIGDHSVILAGPSERIVLTHLAQDRSIFANGALKAAAWALDKKPGLYSMFDVLGLNNT